MTKNGAGYDPEIEDVPIDLNDNGATKEGRKIIVPFTELDLQELMEGEELTWVFKLTEDEDIELILRKEREGDYQVD